MRRKLHGLIGLAAGFGFALSPVADAQQLIGLASLPADSFVSGPHSGQFIQADQAPFAGQPVQGFSSLISDGNGGFLALADNGFGAKGNSADFVLQVYRLQLSFSEQGAGQIQLEPAFVLSDPDRLLGFGLVADRTVYPDSDIPVDSRVVDGRWLTGADLDPESIRAAPNGGYWIGEEFGPFLIHVDEHGRVNRPPVSVPGIFSPDRPRLDRAANIRGSAGIEAMAREAGVLHFVLEKPLPDDEQRLLPWYRFNAAAGEFVETQPWRHYPLPAEASAVGAMAGWGDGKFLLIERDSGGGSEARHKKLVMVDLEQHEDGILRRHEVLDLLDIPDPQRISGSSNYAMPFVTIEIVLKVADDQILIVNDNNYPFGSGRVGLRGGSENTEFALIQINPGIASTRH